MIFFKKRMLARFLNQNPTRLLIGVYCLIAVLGFAALCLPATQKVHTKIIDNLFIATSAISTTGLTSVSVSDNYNFFGQLIILFLIQIGGLHYMAFGSILLLTTKRKFSKLEKDLIKTDFSLPEDFDIYTFTYSVIIFSLLVEVIGAFLLYLVFLSNGTENPLWNAAFHSISAFCTAGFSLFNTSFEAFAYDPLLNITILSLSFLGAIGFIAVTDYYQKWTRKKKDVTLTTKIIIFFSVIASFLGAFLLLFTHSLSKDTSFTQKIWVSLFQSASALTTVGFNTLPMAEMSHSALYLLVILMVIGASPAGTGGGIKSTTIVAILAQMFSTFRGKANVTFLGYQIPSYRLRLANANFTFYIILLTIGVYIMTIVDNHSVFEIVFETASALGTVGLSMGITSSLTFSGKLTIIIIMMLGRIGPLSLGLALLYEKNRIDDIGWYEDVAI